MPPIVVTPETREVFESWLVERSFRVDDGDFVELRERHVGRAAELFVLWRDFLLAQSFLEPSATGHQQLAAIVATLGLPSLEAQECVGELGRGGMGVVERVWDRRLERHVARKVLPIDVRRPLGESDGRRLSRFMVEARLLGRLQHPGIVPAHDLGIDEQGRPFFTMPVVEGVDLATAMSRGAAGDPEWSMTRVLRILVDVCHTVSYAHSNGVVHRDIKSSNIMLGSFGEVLLLDWGLARDLDEAPGAASSKGGNTPDDSPILTRHGEIVGTPCYMAPELARGERASPLSDQYAIGAILYELLCHTPPYLDVVSDATGVVVRSRSQPPTAVGELAPRTPGELVAICEKSMARDAGNRYADVAHLGADLHAFLEQRVVAATGSRAWTALRKWVARNPALAAAVALIVVLVPAALVTLNVLQARHRSTLEDTNRELKVARDTAAGRLEDLRRTAYFDRVRLVQQSMGEGMPASRLRAMLDSCDADLRGWEWRFLSSRVCVSNRVYDTGVRNDGTAVAVSIPANRLAVATLDTIHVFDLRTGAVLDRRPVAGVTVGLDFGPRGRLLVTGSNHGVVHVVDLRKGGGVRKLAIRSAAAPVFSRDADTILTGGPDGVQLVDIHDGAVVGEPLLRSQPIERVAVSPSGRFHAAAYWGKLFVWRTKDPSKIHEFRGADSPTEMLGFDLAGRKLHVGRQRGQVSTIDTATMTLEQTALFPGRAFAVQAIDPTNTLYLQGVGASLRVYSFTHNLLLDHACGHDRVIRGLVFVPRGVVSVAADGTARSWEVDNSVRSLLHTGQELLSVRVSADGRTVVGCGWDDTVAIWQKARGSRRLPAGRPPNRALALSPDGRLLLSRDRTDRLVIRDLETGEVRHRLPVRLAWATTATWSHDGRWIVTADERHRVILYDVRSSTQRVLVEGERVPHAAFDPIDRWFVVSAAGRTRRFDLPAGNDLCRETWSVPHGGDVAVSPDAGRAALGSSDGVVRLLDAATGRVRHEFTAHEKSVTRVAFGSDGRLFSSGYDGTLKVFEPMRSEPILTFAPDHDPLQCLALSPDGETLCAGGRAGLLHAWFVGPQ